MTDAQIIRRHSKSFALAARLLAPRERRAAEALYAWCRAADDAVDHANSPDVAFAQLEQLRAEIAAIYAGQPVAGPARALAFVVNNYQVPRDHPEAMLAGFEMDVRGTHYQTVDELLLYCHRVAGVVGLMMCQTFGVTDPRALTHADQLGIAMQLTNVARDVQDDWRRGRLYLPADWLTHPPQPGLPLDDDALRPAVQRLLALARDYYHAGERGLAYLPPRCRLAVRVASRVYAEIGQRIERQGTRVTAPRVVVPGWRKAQLVAQALAATVWPTRS